jgi:hypothetical protein
MNCPKIKMVSRMQAVNFIAAAGSGQLSGGKFASVG